MHNLGPSFLKVGFSRSYNNRSEVDGQCLQHTYVASSRERSHAQPQHTVSGKTHVRCPCLTLTAAVARRACQLRWARTTICIFSRSKSSSQLSAAISSCSGGLLFGNRVDAL